MRAPLLAGLLAGLLGGGALAAPLEDPPVFASEGGALHLIFTARPQAQLLGGRATTTWVHEVCRRADATATECLPGTALSPYGGVQLRLGPDDRLHIRLVNRLPPAPEAEACREHPALAGNPTNLHTHGLIVEPHRAMAPGDPYGDYAFLELRNPANAGARCAGRAGGHAGHGAPAGASHPDADVVDDAVEYRFDLHAHPPGFFWLHPHVHGLTANQVSAGMAGVITVGSLADHCGADAACRAAIAATPARLLVLKDSQLAADGRLQHQQDPGFCAPRRGNAEAPRQGHCAGIGPARGGRWVHTVNGQHYPEIAVPPAGEIWQVLNASATRSYDLTLEAPDGGPPLPLEVLALDGVGIGGEGATLGRIQEELGGRAQLFACHDGALCTRRLRLLPSARVAVRVGHNDTAPQAAVLRTAMVPTGGDDWPAIDLAAVTLAPGRLPPLPRPRVGEAATVAELPGHVARIRLPGRGESLPVAAAQAAAAAPLPGPGPGQARAHAIDPALALGLRQDPACRNLAPGERRRIYFGNPTPGKDGFGLASSVIGADGRERALTPMRSYDPTRTNICLTAAPAGAAPVIETWEVINLTGEAHNFHIHQTRFWLRPTAAEAAPKPAEALALEDNAEVPRARAGAKCDGTLAAYRRGACRPQPLRLAIPLSQIGDFVFHCHILEHEDGGMMARIRVVAPPAKPQG
jgi:FtsP/CotA-like multicopper oxidase with cupredoxin domain